MYSLTATSTTAIPASNLTFEGLSANRFLPWLLRDLNSCYPVKVPNAYSKIYIFPIFFGSTNDDVANGMPRISTLGSYVAPYIIPFGLLPETRGHTTANKLHELDYRFPDDVVTAANPTHLVGLDTRTNGLWIPLMTDGTSFANTNGTIAAVGTSTAFARGTLGAGAGYSLPDDMAVSLAGTNALANNASQFAVLSPIASGMGTMFETHGCEEIVVALGSNPSGAQVQNSACVSGKVYKAHFALMGVFLG